MVGWDTVPSRSSVVASHRLTPPSSRRTPAVLRPLVIEPENRGTEAGGSPLFVAGRDVDGHDLAGVPRHRDLEPSGEATEAYVRRSRSPLGQDVAGADVDHPPVSRRAVAGDLWTIAVLPSPIGVELARGELEGLAPGKGLGVQEVGPLSMSPPTSRLRPSSTYATITSPSTIPSRMIRPCWCRGPSRCRAAGFCPSPTYRPPSGCQVPTDRKGLPAGTRVGGVASPVAVSTNLTHPLPVSSSQRWPPAARLGRGRRARTPRRRRPGSSAAGTSPSSTSPRCAASSRLRPRRPGHRPG